LPRSSLAGSGGLTGFIRQAHDDAQDDNSLKDNQKVWQKPVETSKSIQFKRMKMMRRKSLSPISRLVDILPDDAFGKDTPDDNEKEKDATTISKSSVARIGLSPAEPLAYKTSAEKEKVFCSDKYTDDVTSKNVETKSDNVEEAAESHPGQSLPNQPSSTPFLSRKSQRLSVTNRIESMLKDAESIKKSKR